MSYDLMVFNPKTAPKSEPEFFDPSGDGIIMFPDENGILEAINKKLEPKPWWKFWG